MKRSTWILGVLVSAAAVAALAWAFAPRPIDVELAVATKGRFESWIEEDAKTRVRDRYVVSVPLAGQLARISLREGDAVQAGDVVATLLPALAPLQDERTLREQQIRVDIARANAERAKARVARAEVGVQQAASEVLRSEALAQQGFVAATKLENDRLQRQAAERERDGAREEQQAAVYEVAQARAALEAVSRPGGQRSFALRAPVSGQVLRVAQASEGTVALGTPLLEIGDIARMELVAELLTTDALQVSPGSAVSIERWGGDAALAGRVRAIEPAAFTKISALGVEEQRVRVLIDITTPQRQWRSLGDGFRVFGIHTPPGGIPGTVGRVTGSGEGSAGD